MSKEKINSVTIDRIEGDDLKWAVLLENGVEEAVEVEVPLSWLPDGVEEGTKLSFIFLVGVNEECVIYGLKPGEIAPKSGQYRQEGPNGERGPQRTVVKGEPLPPTLQENMTYRLVDSTETKV